MKILFIVVMHLAKQAPNLASLPAHHWNKQIKDSFLIKVEENYWDMLFDFILRT